MRWTRRGCGLTLCPEAENDGTADDQPGLLKSVPSASLGVASCVHARFVFLRLHCCWQAQESMRGIVSRVGMDRYLILSIALFLAFVVGNAFLAWVQANLRSSYGKPMFGSSNGGPSCSTGWSRTHRAQMQRPCRGWNLVRRLDRSLGTAAS